AVAYRAAPCGQNFYCFFFLSSSKVDHPVKKKLGWTSWTLFKWREVDISWGDEKQEREESFFFAIFPRFPLLGAFKNW
ncbi:hypothetical protein J8I29_29845, partial [Labrys sp. LIt4]